MSSRMSIFAKVMIIILLLLVPIVCSYTYSNRVSTRVVEQELLKSNENRLSFFVHQMDTTADQLWKAAFSIMNDPDAIKLQFKSILDDSYEVIETKDIIASKIALQSNTINWENDLAVYAPGTRQAVSTDPLFVPDWGGLSSYGTEGWYGIRGVNGEAGRFSRFLTQPYMSMLEISKASTIVEVSFSAENLSLMLKQLQQGTDGESFLFSPGYPTIAGTGESAAGGGSWLVSQTADALAHMSLEDLGSRTLELEGKSYILTYKRSLSLGWYVVDVMPLAAMLQPIAETKLIFYLSMGLLVLMSLLAASILYRNVQVPVRELIYGVRRLKKGDYSIRMPSKTNNEFQFLFLQFNDMADEIGTLIEKVYKEEIRVREANLKQLQSQINPHFLYNSFAFIQSLAQLDNREAIIAVSQHLSGYYRYTTRLERPLATLEEELGLVRDYLEIHQMQMHRLRYEIHVPDKLLQEPMPRLMLQPLAENAIIHGIEEKPGQGVIRITGEDRGEYWSIAIEDNGAGLAPLQLAELASRLEACQVEDKGGCGLWNVRQRLLHRYGSAASMSLERSAQWGGLKAVLTIPRGNNHDTAIGG